MGIAEDLKELAMNEGLSEDEATDIVETLKDDAKKTGKTLKELIKEGGKVIAQFDLNLVSGVNSPVQRSQTLMLKSDDNVSWKSDIQFMLDRTEKEDDKQDEEKQISYAAVLVPGEADKESDIPLSSGIEEAAWDFQVNNDTDAIDVEHNGDSGKGHVVETWVLKNERTFKTPDGDEITYPEGTWIIGVKWDDTIWPHVKSGNIQGFSIYGRGKSLDLDGLFKNIKNNKKSEVNKMADENEDNNIGMTDLNDTLQNINDSVKNLNENYQEIKDSLDNDEDDSGEDSVEEKTVSDVIAELEKVIDEEGVTPDEVETIKNLIEEYSETEESSDEDEEKDEDEETEEKEEEEKSTGTTEKANRGNHDVDTEDVDVGSYQDVLNGD